MRCSRLYLLHPQDRFLPGVAGWIEEVRNLLTVENDWAGWDLACIPYDEQNGFRVANVVSRVLSHVGPVVLVEPVQTTPRELLREKLRSRCVYVIVSASDPTELWAACTEVRTRFESGEPFLPRKLVAAVLLVRKLERGRYWGGKDKGYMYVRDLAKGRGVDEQFVDVIPEVANDLHHKEILIKKTSQGRAKYALNPQLKQEVYAIVNERMFENEQLRRFLERDKREVSARLLDKNP